MLSAACDSAHGSPLPLNMQIGGAKSTTASRAGRAVEVKSAHGSRDLSSKLRVERVERTSGSGDDRGRPKGSVGDAARVSPGPHKDVYYRGALSRPDVGEAPPYAIGASLYHVRRSRRDLKGK